MTGPIFVISNPRSGSTLLRTMLARHSEISIPHEFPLVSTLIDTPINDLATMLTFVDSLYTDKHFVEWLIPKKDLLDRLQSVDVVSSAAIIETIYSFFLDPIIAGKTVWGEKNIGNIAYVDDIKGIFPDARFIFLVRDPKDIALSLANRRWRFYQYKEHPKRCLKSIVGIASLLSDGFTMINRHVERGLGLLVRYEDLVREPSGVLSEICLHLGVDFEEQMLDTAIHSLPEQLRISDKRVMSDHKNVFKPVAKPNYSSSIDPEAALRQHSYLQSHLQPLVNKYGYLNNPVASTGMFAVRSKIAYPLIFLTNSLLVTSSKIMKWILR